MTRIVPVRAGETEFLIEVVEPEGEEDIALMGLMDFEDVVEMLGSVGAQLSKVWEAVRPSEAAVEIGVEASVKEGKLTGLLVSGGGKGTLSVKLTWKFE